MDRRKRTARTVALMSLFSMTDTQENVPVASFYGDGSDLVSLIVGIDPVQAGSGDPSPDNVRPISGWTECKVTRTGKNLFDANSIANNGNISVAVNDDVITLTMTEASKNRSAWYDIPAKQLIGKTVCLSGSQKHTGNNPGRVILRSIVNDSFNNLARSPEGDNTFSLSAIIPKCDYIRVFLGVTGNDSGQEIGDTAVYSNIQLEIGSTASAYEPYQGNTYTIQFGDTVYGGTLDVTTGKLTVDRGMVDLGTLPWQIRESLGGFSTTVTPTPKNQFAAISSCYPYCGPYSSVTDKAFGYVYNSHVFVKDSDYSDVASLKTALSGQTLVYELATPIEVQLTPTEINTLLGTNNILANTGEIKYIEYNV